MNGRTYRIEAEPHTTLNYVLREQLGLTGTKRGCDTGGCGACTVLLDGKAVYSCMTNIFQAAGKEVRTIEGLSLNRQLSPVQDAFIKVGGLQCGFCTPGFVISVTALLETNPHPSEEEIREALVGNVCRCTGYSKVLEAVGEAAKVWRESAGTELARGKGRSRGSNNVKKAIAQVR